MIASSKQDSGRHERKYSGVAINDVKSIGLPLRHNLTIEFNNLTKKQYQEITQFLINTRGIYSFEISYVRPFAAIYRLLDGEQITIEHGDFIKISFSVKWLRTINEYGVYDDNGIYWDKVGIFWDDGNVWS